MMTCGCSMMKHQHISHSLCVCVCVNKQFLGCWTEHGSQTSHASLSWPPHNPDLIHWTPHSEALSRDKCLHTSVSTMMTCTEQWNTHLPLLILHFCTIYGVNKPSQKQANQMSHSLNLCQPLLT